VDPSLAFIQILALVVTFGSVRRSQPPARVLWGNQHDRGTIRMRGPSA